ncbi:hypothetical protein T4B_12670 [Trichinella pseudospiralis]|uniref:Uncharacterized protein n=2 Tax=Trichinella pseudospiralis TaxID=6337 RepID=A0A0V1FDV1_TRIPS|nr:hypothetical protein T4E_11748 [Trichinella pseudospiralis]KRY84234.1 hypothetical protein T4D_14448 [Trichinella pseudospiralis]KRZ25039.1 hypothetical protein T4B_12670 [Trichinella pseudospiralis]
MEGFQVKKFHGNVPCSHALRRFAKEVVNHGHFGESELKVGTFL